MGRTTVSAHEALSGVQFSHEHWSRESKGSTYSGLAVKAEHPKYGVVGEMSLRPEPDEHGGREILDMKALFPGRGIGTGMYRHAQEAGLNPQHSADRTDQGERWAHKVGGELPPRSDNFR